MPPSQVDEDGVPVEPSLEDKRIDPSDAMKTVEEDWVYDSAGTELMSKDAFFKSWFEVCSSRATAVHPPGHVHATRPPFAATP